MEGLEAQATAAREAAERAAVAAQWKVDAEAALAAGEWGAARMAVGRWLAAAPEDGEARAFLGRVKAAAAALEAEEQARMQAEESARREVEERARMQAGRKRPA